MNVFTPDEAKHKRGANADEMITCPKCGEQQGVHVFTPFSIDGNVVNRRHIELWNCLSCRHRWWEEFTVMAPETGVVGDLFRHIMNRRG